MKQTHGQAAGILDMIRRAGIAAIVIAALPQAAAAHPHVFVESNLEILRDAQGNVTELRHVWRFDDLFSSDVLLNYDANGDGKLDAAELDEVGRTVGSSIAEYDYYTEVRSGSETDEFNPPEAVMVDYVDNQVLMFFSLKMKEPVSLKGKPFKVSVSDPTFYVAMEIASDAAVQVTGEGAACKVQIDRPDFDKLNSQSSLTLTEQFFADPKNASLGDDWLTWVSVECP
ncbi:MAG: DUF1007 family protein [Nitratireductor sp.]